jgi:hypothetical protein
MKRTTLKMAALALGGAMTLLLPVTAAARDRDDSRRGDQNRGRMEQHWDRDHDRGRGVQYRGRDWDHDRGGFRFSLNFGAPTYRVVTPGYYDQFGYWHPPVYQNY